MINRNAVNRAVLVMFIALFIGSDPVSAFWARRYNGSGTTHDRAYTLVVDSAGNIYVSGSSQGTNTDPYNRDFLTIKYSPTGTVLWSKQFGGTLGLSDSASVSALDCNGNLYVAGVTDIDERYGRDGGINRGNPNYTIVKYSPTGTQLWVRSYNGAGNGNDYVQAIGVDSSNNVYITGKSQGPVHTASGVSTQQYATVKYDSNGNLKWSKAFGSFTTGGKAIKVNSSGVYVTGGTSSQNIPFTTIDSYATIKYSFDGNQVWVKTYKSTGTYVQMDTAAEDITSDSSGNIYVTGTEFGNEINDTNIRTIKYSSTGTQVWSKLYNSGTEKLDMGSSLNTDSSGNVYVAGRQNGKALITVKYLANGTLSWAKIFPITNPANDHTYSKVLLLLDSSANVYISGILDGDYKTLKYNTSGTLLWNKSYGASTSAYDIPMAAKLDQNKNVIVTGTTNDGTGDDFLTIKYDTNGN
jgi:hypothetical protein